MASQLKFTQGATVGGDGKSLLTADAATSVTCDIVGTTGSAREFRLVKKPFGPEVGGTSALGLGVFGTGVSASLAVDAYGAYTVELWVNSGAGLVLEDTKHFIARDAAGQARIPDGATRASCDFDDADENGEGLVYLHHENYAAVNALVGATGGHEIQLDDVGLPARAGLNFASADFAVTDDAGADATDVVLAANLPPQTFRETAGAANSIGDALFVEHSPAGSPSGGNGVRFILRALNDNPSLFDAGAIRAIVDDVSTGSEQSYLQLMATQAGALVSVMSLWAEVGRAGIGTGATTPAGTLEVKDASASVPTAYLNKNVGAGAIKWTTWHRSATDIYEERSNATDEYEQWLSGTRKSRLGAATASLFVAQTIQNATASTAVLTLDKNAGAGENKLISFSRTTPGERSSLKLNAADDVVLERSDATTSTALVSLTLRRLTSGTAAAGIGSILMWELQDAGGATEQAASIRVTLENAGASSEESRMSFRLRTGGAALAEAMQLDSTLGLVMATGKAIRTSTSGLVHAGHQTFTSGSLNIGGTTLPVNVIYAKNMYGEGAGTPAQVVMGSVAGGANITLVGGTGGNRIQINSTGIGFFGATPIAKPAAYTLNAGSVSRDLPSGATTAQVEQCLRQLLTDLNASNFGLLATS